MSLGSAPTSAGQLGWTETTILYTSANISNNVAQAALTTSTCPVGVWLISYQATVYYALANTTTVYLTSYVGIPSLSGSGITHAGTLNTGPNTLANINSTLTSSCSFCIVLTSATSFTLYIAQSANNACMTGGIDKANVQSTFITATRIA